MADAPTALEDVPRVPERALGDDLDIALREATTPFVVRGIAADWPLVRAGQQSGKAAREYLRVFARDVDVPVSTAAPEAKGRLFYQDSMEVNFRSGTARFAALFDGYDAAEGRADAMTAYLGSLDIGHYFPGLSADNRIDLGARSPLESVWIGQATTIAAHNDHPDNLAVCAVGRRRFTLFPPDQFANLYLGPIDNTPAGRAVSLVDWNAIDDARFPNARAALATAQIAELNAGDALFIPSLWYHQVEALAPFNVLVNYWWRDTPRYLGQPQNALNHAILAIRDLPADERATWAAMFDHYVFSGGAAARDHIPVGKRGVLDPLDADHAGRLHAFLLRSLSR